MLKINIKNKYKLYILLIIIIICIIFVIKLIPKDFKNTYKVDNYIIDEIFNNKKQEYVFIYRNDDSSFVMTLNGKYTPKRRLVTSVKTFSEDNTICINSSLKNKLNAYPLCLNDSEYISPWLTSDNMLNNLGLFKDNSNLNNSISNVNIFNYIDRSYLIWQYNKFEYLSQTKNSELDLFNNDYYNIDLAASVNNYLVIPNYDSGYSFNELKLINLDNLKVTTWDIKYNISMESYILGTHDNSIFLVDRKNKLEFEIVPHKKKIRIIGTESRGGLIYDEDDFKRISMDSLIQSKLNFNTNNTKYDIDNNTLFFNNNYHKIKISSLNVKKIIKQVDNSVYYLVDDNLYYYDPLKGEIKVMSSFEWNFNYDNIIFPIIKY